MGNVKQYMKVPRVVEAMRYNGPDDTENIKELVEWTDSKFEVNTHPVFEPEAHIYDYLHDSWIMVKPGDYVMKGLEGEFYPHDGDIFSKAYEEVSEEEWTTG